MDGIDEFYFAKIKCFAAAMIHWVGVLYPLRFKPRSNFKIGYYRGVILIGYGLDVCYMVTVAMADEDIIRNNRFQIYLFRQFVRRNIRVKQYLLIVDLNQKGGMAIIGNRCHFNFDLVLQITTKI